MLHVPDARREVKRQVPHPSVPAVLADVQRKLFPVQGNNRKVNTANIKHVWGRR